MKSDHHMTGFTIIELLITLIVAAILATLAAPSFTDLIKNNRLSAQYNELLSHITLARSEAVKRTSEIKVLNNNGTNSGVWDSGWIVYQDLDEDDTVDSGEEILVSNVPSNNITVRFSNNGQITYQPDGLGRTSGIFTLCDDRTVQDAKGLIINSTGRVRVATDTNGDGIVDNGSAATNLSCP